MKSTPTLYRILEVVPGACAWATLVSLAVLSWRLPAWVAVFIVLFDLYWLIKTIYLLSCLAHSFNKMKQNMKVNWLSRLEEGSKQWEEVYHLIIMPAIREPYEVVRESVKSIANANYPKNKIIFVLALEERGGIEDRIIGKKIEQEFGGVFGKFLITEHPDNLPGEIRGKGSNQAWAAKEALQKVIDKKKIPYENILVSVLDSDSRLGKEYLPILTHAFINSKDGGRASYQPIPLFTNNAHNVSLFARLLGFTATFWQMMQHARPEQLTTFSSHSMPLKALVEVGLWHKDVVSEDSRIFFQCLNHFNGNWRVEPIAYPVYMDAVSGGNFWDAVKNLYKQQRRWAWGSESFAYIVYWFLRKKEIPFKVKKFWTIKVFEGFYSWSTASFIIFLFGWLPNVLGGEAFYETMLSYNLPRLTGFLMQFSMLGIAVSAWLSLILLPPQEENQKKKVNKLKHLVEWIFIPVTFIVFSGIPALDAQTRLMLGGKYRLGFWRTPKQAATQPPSLSLKANR